VGAFQQTKIQMEQTGQHIRVLKLSLYFARKCRMSPTRVVAEEPSFNLCSLVSRWLVLFKTQVNVFLFIGNKL